MMYTIALFDENDKVVEVIPLDVVDSFTEDYDGSAPQSPVENGYNLTDNLSLSNDKFSMSGTVSDSLFKSQAGLVQYIAGEFIRAYEGVEDGIVSSSPSKVVKDRLKAIRDKKEHFGIIVSTSPYTLTDTGRGSVVELIYPCIMTKLSFKDEGTNAVYPNISFEKVRIATTSFVVVDNPTPELIPYAKDAINAGNKTGVTGSSDLAVDPSQSADAKALAKAMGEDTKVNNTRETYEKMKDKQRELTLQAYKESNAKINNGTLSNKVSDQYVADKVNAGMSKEFGIHWKARLDN